MTDISPKRNENENIESLENDEIPSDSDLKRQYKESEQSEKDNINQLNEENDINNQYQIFQEGQDNYNILINQGYSLNEEGQLYQIAQNGKKYQIYQIAQTSEVYGEPQIVQETENQLPQETNQFQEYEVTKPGSGNQVIQHIIPQQIHQFQQGQQIYQTEETVLQPSYVQIIENNNHDNKKIYQQNQEYQEYPVSQVNKQNSGLYKIVTESQEYGVNQGEYDQSRRSEEYSNQQIREDEYRQLQKNQIYQLQQNKIGIQGNKKDNNIKQMKNTEPKDSISKMYIKSKNSNSKKNKNAQMKRNIPPLSSVSFKVISANKIINPNINIDKKKLTDFEEIPREEYEKYSNNKTLFIEGGMNTGQYKFRGDEMVLKLKEIPEEVKISEVDVLEEINRRTNRKEKKIKYEIMDKFFTLTEFERNNIKDKELQNNEINDNKNTNINNNEQNPKQDMNAAASPSDNYSRYLLEQINKIRVDPQAFIGVIEDAKANIEKHRYGGFIYKGKIKIALSEGEPAFDEAIEFLKNTETMEILEFSPELTVQLPQNENELKNSSDLRTKVENMLNEGISIKSYWRDVIRDPEISFLLMIVDDNGARKGMRRKDILNPKMKYIGISSIDINGNFACYITLSSKLME